MLAIDFLVLFDGGAICCAAVRNDILVGQLFAAVCGAKSIPFFYD